MPVNQIQPESKQAARAVRTAVIGDSICAKIEKLFHLDIRSYRALDSFLENSSAAEQKPELIILFQTLPDQFSPSEIDQLFETHPLSRILVAYGSYCESDGRTRSLWPQALRVPNWKLLQRVEREIDVLRGHSSALPLTATREETVHFEYLPFSHINRADRSEDWAGDILIFSPDSIWAETVSTILTALNLPQHKTIGRLDKLDRLLAGGPSGFSQIIFDIDPFNQKMKEWLCDHLIDPGKNYIVNPRRKQPVFPHPITPEKSGNRSSKQSADSVAVHLHPEQILAVTNWLTPHRCKELEQSGIIRQACKLNMSEILAALAPKAS